jgi:DnaJ family protein C protein 28
VSFDRVIEQLIRQAQEDGKFRDLPGHGQPLNLDDNPFEDAAAAMANHMLKNQGFRPDWLEDDVAVRQGLEQARLALARTRDWRREQLRAAEGRQDARAIEQRALANHEWALAQERFRARLAELNRAIFTLNLKVPSERFQRLRLDVEAELRRVADA